jgi:urocanate hydratase
MSHVSVDARALWQSVYLPGPGPGALAKLKGWDSLKGKFVLTAGLGGMGGAQPLAITMNEGVGHIVEVDPERADPRCAIRFANQGVWDAAHGWNLLGKVRVRD